MTNDIAEAMLDVGLCDVGTYTGSDYRPQVGRLFVNRGTHLFGQQGSVINGRVTIRLVCADFVNPGELGATIDVDGETFVVDSVVPSEGEGNDTLTVLVRSGAT
jgi:hypothetical protein